MSEQDTDHSMVRVEPATDGVPSLALRRSTPIQQLLTNDEPENNHKDKANTDSLPPARPDGPLRFFDLPSEIRNMIYRYLVSFPKGVIKADAPSHSLNIFLANRRFFNEASALFYAENTFIIYSCYTRLCDEPPFSPRLDRIQRCLLHLSSTQNHRNAFLSWFNKSFVDALTPNHSLKFLIIRVTLGQFDTLDPLIRLSGIEYAQVDLGQPPPWRFDIRAHPNMVRDRSMGIFLDRWDGNRAGFKSVSQQMLERSLMREASPTRSSGGEETCRIDDLIGSALDYVWEPTLAMGLEPGKLREAKEKGGWRRNFELYDFLGIDRHRWIRVGSSYGIRAW
ncbi:MAG: hypothetical protein Q9212_007047 [Teloschistes hypoglaucus]